jgi:hypothetical protein
MPNTAQNCDQIYFLIELRLMTVSKALSFAVAVCSSLLILTPCVLALCFTGADNCAVIATHGAVPLGDWLALFVCNSSLFCKHTHYALSLG